MTPQPPNDIEASEACYCGCYERQHTGLYSKDGGMTGLYCLVCKTRCFDREDMGTSLQLMSRLRSSRLEVETEKARTALLEENVKHVDHLMAMACKGYTNFARHLEKPHYFTQQELVLFQDKGIEALFLHWRMEMNKLDDERSKDFPPKP